MKPGLLRALVPLGVAALAASCTSPARTDAASLPPATTTTTLPAPTSTTAAVSTTSTLPEEGPDIIAWMGEPAAGPTLAEAVAAWPGVGRVDLVTSEEALDEFAALYADRPGLVEGVGDGVLPASLRIELTHPSFLPDVAAQLRSLSDVAEVITAVTPACNAFPDWNVVVFVGDDRDLTRIHRELAAAEGLAEITAVGRDAAYAEYLERFAALAAGPITVQDMSVSLRARTSNPVTLTLLAQRFEGDLAVTGVQVFPPGAPDCP